MRGLERRFIFRVNRFLKDKNVRGTACILMAIDKRSARPRGKLAGSAYDTKGIREYLRRRGIKANILVNQRNRRKPKHGRPYML